MKRGIPISVSLDTTMAAENMYKSGYYHRKRLFFICVLAVLIGLAISLIARVLMSLINLITGFSFLGEFTLADVTPTQHTLGVWVIAIPVIGGIIVGFMALFGSRAIRGHGIPEAMEQILTNQSKIKPSITYLKPISSAIVIGTGGPFGAEGPIIATGGALGSTLGQLLKITSNERKILLAAGATAGMSAIFGTPIAAIFLAIELLLFEFSPRAIIPVALACITGAAGHHFLFDSGPVFPMSAPVEMPTNQGLLLYSGLGVLMGVVSVGVTKAVYLVEDAFEKIPVHWMWWPAIGGLAVGIIGYFAPNTLGVGYENIVGLLSGHLPLTIVLSLCFLKFLSWVIALGSGTSGGTLAPLLTIGGAAGILMGLGVLRFFPDAPITTALCALTGMAALFAGSSRALLTSIVFALEITGQSNALLPLLAACTGSYMISFFFMKGTIMTEKITRRGVKTPDSFSPDILDTVRVENMMSDGLVISGSNTVGEVRDWLATQEAFRSNYFIIVNDENKFTGIISSSNLFGAHHNTGQKVADLVKGKVYSIRKESSLKSAVELMANENIDIVPVVDQKNEIQGMVSYQNILNAYKQNFDNDYRARTEISLKRGGMKVLVKGKRLMDLFTSQNSNDSK